MIKDKSKIYSVSAKISEDEMNLAIAFIKGAVHCFCKNNPEQTFSVKTLFGGANNDWNDNPLQVFYDYYSKSGCVDAEKRAAQDVGKLLKSVLDDDKRRLFVENTNFTKEYTQI